MIKKIKRIICLLILFNVLMILIPNNTYAFPSSNNYFDYYFKSYDIKVIVNEDNTLEITETIGAYFNVSKHGIFRKIPTKNTVERLDGTVTKNRVNIRDIKVNENYTVSNEAGYKTIKIGDPDRTFIGNKDYVISYLYSLGKDNVKEYDELYFNLIGDAWDTRISNITFTIVMPKDFDQTKLGFSSGRKGTVNSSGITYEVNNNIITGKVDKTLNPSEALTVRLELPEGYFIPPAFKISSGAIVSLILPVIFAVIGYFIWKKYGDDEDVVETVEFYPPDGLNSLEVGFLYKGYASNEDVTSLLIYLANKGYLKITEVEKKSLFSTTKDFKITKLKEYDGNNLEEEIFFNGLFKKKKTFSLFGLNNNNSDGEINEVTSSDLYDNFYVTMNKILFNANNKENKNKVFEKKASGKNIFIILMIIAIFLIITMPPLFYYGETELGIIALLFPGIGFTFMFSMLLEKNQTIYVNGVAKKSKNGIKFFGLIWGSMFGGMPWALMVLPALLQDYLYLIIYIVGLISVFILVVITKYLPKRTPYGNKMLGKINGFKNFLETAEKDRLEMMVMENPTYFYDILPYTYVLDVSDKWIKNFESISLQAPTWYDGYDSFSITNFGGFMNNTMTSANRSMSSSPSSSSSSSGGGGSSSGGGSSGGGSGGGGGGSW